MKYITIPSVLFVLIACTSKELKIYLLDEKDLVPEGFDGLEYYENHLYAIQIGVQANGFNFRKLIMNEAKDKIVGFEIIDSGNPELYAPLSHSTLRKTKQALLEIRT